MWLTGRCGSTVGLWLAGPAEGCHRRRRGSPSSAGMGMVGGRAGWATRVVTFDVSGSGAVNRWGAAPRTCTDVEGRKLGVASSRRARTRPVPQGVGRADGRAVVMGCDEPLARGGGATGEGWRGLVWCKSGLPAGISRCAGLLLVGWRAAEVVTRLSQVVRNMVGRREIR